MVDLGRGLIDIVLVVRLDRLGRSLKHLVTLLAQFNEHKIALVSLKEGLDFTSSTGKLLFHIIGALAEFERELIRDRVRSGLAYAKSRGVRIGRPLKVSSAIISQIHDMKAKGASLRTIAKALGISRSAAHKVITVAKQSPN